MTGAERTDLEGRIACMEHFALALLENVAEREHQPQWFVAGIATTVLGKIETARKEACDDTRPVFDAARDHFERLDSSMGSLVYRLAT